MQHSGKTRAFLVPLICILFFVTSYAQIRPGIKFGLSTPDIDPKEIVVQNPQGEDYITIFVERARYGIHAGVFVQFQFGGFFIQPEGLYNSTSIEYKVDSIGFSDIFTDTYRSLDFPVIMGLKVGPVRLGGGPVAHIQFREQGGFNDYDNFEAFFRELTWGWQAGIGFDFWKLHADLRYEGNFSKLGDHITFFDRQFDFDTNNNRIIASLGFSF